ncbi:MAG: tandem-95 repeat protein, partial [Betaproteobacteria bacterium]
MSDGTDFTIDLSAGTTYTFSVADFGFTATDGSSFGGVLLPTWRGGDVLLDGTPLVTETTVTAERIAAGRLTFVAPTATGAGQVAFNVLDSNGDYDAVGNAALFRVAGTNSAPTVGAGDGIAAPRLLPTDVAGSYLDARRVIVQPDGKVLVMGQSGGIDGAFDFFVARFNPDGTPDAGFGAGGRSGYTVGGTGTGGARGLALMPDGRIVVSGADWDTGNARLTRFNANGALDTTYGSAGVVELDMPGGSLDVLREVVVNPDGSVVAAVTRQGQLGLARFTPSGALDTNFDGDGIAIAVGASVANAYTLVRQSDGRYLVAGDESSNGDDFVVARFNVDGSLDTSFGSNGVARISSGGAAFFNSGLAVQADGKIIVAGSDAATDTGASGTPVVARLLTDGTFDTTFGTAGVVRLSSVDAGIWTAAVQSNGMILLAGNSDGAGIVIRLSANGELDTSFDDDGVAMPAGTSAGILKLALAPDRGIFAAGGVPTGDDAFGPAVIRLNAGGTLDTRFGVPTFKIGGSAVVLDPDLYVSDPQLAGLTRVGAFTFDGYQTADSPNAQLEYALPEIAGNYSGAVLLIQRDPGADSSDVFGATGKLSFVGSSVLFNGTAVGNLNSSTAQLQIVFNSAATQSVVTEALRSITYSNTSSTPPRSVDLAITLLDGNSGAQGDGGALSTTTMSTVNIVSGASTGQRLDGTSGADSIYGGDGADTLLGYGSNDTLDGGAGADTLLGGDGQDTLAGGPGDDVLDGGLGVDVADYSGATGSVTVNLATGVASGAAGVDELIALERVIGSAFGDTITGSAADETFAGNGGADTFVGGGGAGFDFVDYSGVGGAITADLSAGRVLHDGFTDSLTGVPGLIGSAFADTLVGGAGDEQFFGGGGNDTIDGGAGTADIADYGFSAGAVTADLALGRVWGADGTDTLTNIERVYGSNFDDTLYGDAGANFLRGRGGNDTLDGRGGSDTADYRTAIGPVTVNLATGAATGQGTDTLIDLENIRGSLNFADTMIGNAGANSLNGLGGDDTLRGGAGSDTLNGDAGFDYALYDDATVGLVATLNNNAGTVMVGGDTDTLVSVEAVFGTGLNDTYFGGSGSDFFRGLGGDDSFDGGAGSDTFDTQGATAAVVASLAAGTATGGGGNDRFTGVENLYGSAHDDTLTGDAGNNFLRGRAGNDSLDGGAGVDIADYRFAGGAVTVDLANNTASGGDGNDVLANFEGVRTPDGSNDVASGNALDNLFYDGGGNDTYFGGDGNDTLFGGAGNDTLYGGAGDNSFAYDIALDQGVDRFDQSAASGGGVFFFNGTPGVGAFGLQTTILSGDDPTGLRAGQVMVGTPSGGYTRIYIGTNASLGADIQFDIDGSVTAGELVVQNGVVVNGTTGAILAGADATQFGTTGADVINGTSAADIINGLAGNDTINGGGDNDTLFGGEGDDGVYGGAGNDVLYGGAGDDGAFSPNAYLSGGAGADTIYGGDGSDYLQGFEFTSGVSGVGDLADTLYGEAGNDTLRGNAGDDSLFGGDGNDNLRADEGNDLMDGGAGIDLVSYRFDEVSVTQGVVYDASAVGGANATVVLIDERGGTDTLVSIESVFLTGSSLADTLTGSVGGDLLGGMDGNDLIFGGAGDDSIDGGGGDDTVYGGAGSDSFLGSAGDDILDGGAILDRINYTDQNTVGYLNSTAAVTVNLAVGTAVDGQGGTDTLINVNWVAGSGLADTLTGSAALWLEQFDGGVGDDTIDGGAISDTLNQENNNRVRYTGTGSAVTVDLAAGTASGGGGNDRLININQVRGGNLADVLRGSDSTLTEQFEGGAGNDSIDGRGGIDLARYDNAPGAVTVNLAPGIAYDGQGGTDTLTNIEGVRGSAFNDTLLGGNAANGTGSSDGLEIFQGQGGNDWIDGGTGYDRADYTNATSGVTVVLGGGGTGWAVDGQGGTDALLNIEGVRGSAYDDSLTGSDSGVFESFEGREGNDRIDGLGGIDRVDYNASKAGVSVNLASGVALDGYGGTDTLANIEQVRGSRDFADTLIGDGGINSIAGQGGSDHIDGAAGNDTLDGGGGNDTLLGGEGDDGVFGGAGNDVLYGGAGDDGAFSPNAYLSGGAGADTIYGGEGADFVQGFEFNSGVSGTGDLDDTLYGEGGDDIVRGNAGDDSLFGGEGNDNLRGDEGNDLIDGGAGVDGAGYRFDELGLSAGVTRSFSAVGTQATVTQVDERGGTDTLMSVEYVIVTGSSLADSITGSAGGDQIAGGGGNDLIVGGTGDDFNLRGESGDDTIIGGAGADIIRGEDGNDFLSGLTGFGEGEDPGNIDGADTLEGGGGNDVLRSNSGADTLLGGDGNDNLRGDAGNDLIDGGTGVDGAAYRFDELGLTAGVTFSAAAINPAATVALADGRGGTDTLVSVEYAVLTGSSLADTLTGSAGNDQLSGNGGNDRLTGGAGNDSFLFFLDAPPGVDTLTDAQAGDLLTFTRAVPTTFALTTISSGNDATGLALGEVRVGDASGGVTPLRVGGPGGAVTIALEGNYGVSSFAVENGGGIGGLRLVAGPAEGQTFQGGAGTDSYVGGGGDDVLFGNGGNDTLVGDGGDDLLDGGDGSDNLDGGPGNDSLLGGAGDDYLLAGGDSNRGSDVIDGGTGSDTVAYSYFSRTTPVTFVAAEDGIQIDSLGGTDTLTGIEDLQFYGGSAADVFVGNNLRNLIVGNGGDDSLTGGGGQDIFSYNLNTAALGTDRITDLSDGDGLSFSRSGVQPSFALALTPSASGAALLDGQWTLSAPSNGVTRFSLGTDSNPGADLQIDLVGSFNAEDFRVLNFGTNADLFYAAPRNETGSAGNDTYSGGQGRDTYDGLGGDDQINGSGGNDTLSGGEGNDFVSGGSGSDTLLGGAGNDYLIVGGVGEGDNDVVDGGDGYDIASYNFSGWFLGFNFVASDSGTQLDLFGGTDTLISIEELHLFGGNVADVIVGNGLRNWIVGNGGSDTLTGNGGSDSFVYDLAVANGVDRITDLGAGDNLVFFRNSSSFALATSASAATPGALLAGQWTLGAAQGGVTRLYVGVDGNAGADLEIDLVGTVLAADLNVFNNSFGANLNLNAPQVLTGTPGNDLLNGGGGRDTIDGLAGDDTINGNGGADTLTGGDGIDSVWGGDGDDLIYGGAGDDGQVTGYLSGGAGADTLYGGDGNDFLGGFSSNSGVSGAGDLSDTLYGEVGNDVLRGNAGDDSLFGGDGNDNLRGDAGNDLLDGGTGADVVSYRFDQLSLTAGVVFSAAAVGMADTVTLTDERGGTDVLVGIESVVLTGSALADTLTGSAGGDQIAANGGNDSVYGGDGDDAYLDGGDGDDMIDGGAGNDLAGYDAAAGGVTVDLAAGTASGAAGADTLVSIENLSASEFDDSLFGNDGANTFYGQGGNDRITGRAGADVAGFSGAQPGYSVVLLAGGTVQVVDLDAADYNDGTDLLVGIETLRFADGDLAAPLNAPPVVPDYSFTGVEDTVLVGNVLLAATDPQNDPLTATLLTQAAHGSLTFGSDGSFNYSPDANYNGTDSFVFSVSDGQGGSVTATASLTVTPVNDAPFAIDDAASGGEDTLLTGNVLANDSDADVGAVLTASLVTDVVHGSLVLNGNGSFSYTPDTDFFGADSFVYRASDGQGGSATATVQLSVAAVNDAPTALGDNYSLSEDDGLTVAAAAGVLANDSDVDGGSLTAALVTGAAHGTVVLNSDGSFSYTPNANFNGADSFTYRVSDGQGGSTTATAQLSIAAVNDVPLAANDAASVTEDLTAAATGSVLTNDSDIDGTALTATLLSAGAGQYGTLNLQADGSYSYQLDNARAAVNDLNTGDTVSDVFTYRVSDGVLAATATLTVTVNGRDDTLTGSAAADVLTGGGGIDTLLGLGGDDTLTGNAGNDVIQAGAGNDRILGGGAGNDGSDAIEGGNGTDTVVYDYSSRAGSVSLNASADSVNHLGVSVDSLTGVERIEVIGSAGADDIRVDGLSAVLDGGAGNDNLQSGGLDDLLRGGAGADQINAASGTDGIVYRFDLTGATAGVTFAANAAIGINMVVAAGDEFGATDTLMNIEYAAITGTSFGDTLAGSAGSDLLTGGGGSDVLDGGNAGTDTAVYASGVFASQIADFNNGGNVGWTVQVADGDTDTLTGIDFIRHAGGRYLLIGGGGFADVTAALAAQLRGDAWLFAAAPTIDLAGSTDDLELTIATGGTDDVLINTGGGNDVLTVEQTSGGTVTLNAGDGDNSIIVGGSADAVITSGSGTDSIAAGAGNDVIDAGGGDDVVELGDGNDIVDGGDGNDVIVAGNAGGDDLILGGAGSNTVTYPSVGASDSLLVDLRALDRNARGELTPTLIGLLNGRSLALDTPLGLVLARDAGGNVYSNDLLQGIANVTGGAGNDTFIGNAGANGFDGAAGADEARLDDVYGDWSVSQQGNAVLLATGGVTDTLTQIESLRFLGADGVAGTSDDRLFEVGTSGNVKVLALVDTGTATEQGTVAGSDAAGNVLANDIELEAGETATVVGVGFGATNGAAGSALAGAYGTLTLAADGSYSYAVNNGNATVNALRTGQTLAELFAYTVSDGTDVSVSSLTVIINGANDAPAAVADSFTGTEDLAFTGAVLGNDSDVDGDMLTASVVSGPAKGSLTLDPNGSFSYTPNANANGADRFVYRVSDGQGGSATATATVTLTPVNDPPVVVADSYTLNEDATLTVALPGVLGNDSDVDGDALTAVVDTRPSHGELTLDPDGSFSYTPAADYNGTDSFRYRLRDSKNVFASGFGVVTLVVNPVNDAPAAQADAATVTEDVQVSATGNVVTNDSDPEGSTLTVLDFASGSSTATAGTLLTGAYGNLLLLADGSYTYQPDNSAPAVQALNDGDALTDAFTYRVSDGALSATATLAITVRGRNDTLMGGDGNDSLTGSSGIDTIVGGIGNNLLDGGDGDDLIDGGGGNDSVYGGAGDDVLAGGAGEDIVSGGAGDDQLQTSADGVWVESYVAYNADSRQSARLSGSVRSLDQFDGGPGLDTLQGGAGNDIFLLDDGVSGSTAAQAAARGAGLEVFMGGAGDDLISLASNRFLYGGAVL